MATNNSIQFAAFALALTCATSAAAVSPQWTIAVESRVRTQEGPSADLAASWTSLADGSQLLAAVQRGPNGRAALRRIDGHGQIADFAALDPPVNPGEALVLLAAVQDGAYALTSATPDAHASTLYRFAADGSRQWTLRLPSKAYTGDGPAVKLLVHADGSALVLHRRSMTQVTASGEMVWQAGDGNDGQMMQDLADVLIDRQGVIWVGGRGGRAAGARQNDASLRRYSSDGSLLSLHTLPCSPCTNARVMSLAQLSDGKVVAVGRSGTNQPGFFSVRYSDGSERLLALTAPGAGYDRVVADAADNVYALSLDTRTVSAINTADGSVRWHKDGSDITALSNGVLISQSPASGTGTLSLGAFDANGDARWTRQIAANDGSTLGGARQAGGLTRVVAMVEQESAHCGLSPSLVTLDASGTVQADVRACTVPVARSWNGLSTASAAGAIGNLPQRMIRFSAHAEKLWEFSNCPSCASAPGQLAGPRMDASLLMPDGSSWLVTSQPVGTDFPEGEFLLHRFAADGARLSQTALPPPDPAGELHDVRLLADDTQAVVLTSHQGGFRWTRVSATGSLLGSARVTLPGAHPVVAFAATRLWSDGSVSIATRRDHGFSCQTSPPAPVCDGVHHALLRIGPDGTHWRADLGNDPSYIGLEDDGSSVVLTHSWEHDSPVWLRRVDAGGSISLPFTLPDTVGGGFGEAAGPVRGRYLINFVDGFGLVDRNGTVQVRTKDSEYGSSAAFGDSGFIVTDIDREARLVSADDLSVLARFTPHHAGDNPGGVSYWYNWSLLEDGSFYMTEPPTRGNSYRSRLTRFAVPGSPADDVIFIDRF